eukprot:1161897-Pelagomonas_calceolata.AAC.16
MGACVHFPCALMFLIGVTPLPYTHTHTHVPVCSNVAGRELSLLASNQASPDALASALTCIDELALGFCARISDPHESWLPAGAGGARRDDVSQAAGAGEGGASGSRGHARGQESLEEEEEQRCVPTQLGGADPMEVEPAAEASTHSTRGCGVTPLKDVSHEWIARMRRCVCAGQPKFPALTKLVVRASVGGAAMHRLCFWVLCCEGDLIDDMRHMDCCEGDLIDDRCSQEASSGFPA